MITDRKSTENEIRHGLVEMGLELTSDAMSPLKEIPFEKLHVIHDHEEHFLKSVFMDSIQAVRDARLKDGEGTQKVNKQDIRSAMLMLGTAVMGATREQFDKKSLVKDICPYCS